MKKFAIALLAAATALAIPSAALAGPFTFDFSFTTSNTFSSGLGTLTITGNEIAPGEYQITSGMIDYVSLVAPGIDIGGALIPITAGTPGGPDGSYTSPSGFFYYNDIVYDPADPQYLDTYGLLFDVNGTELNIWGNGAAAPLGYTIYDNNGENSSGQFFLTGTPPTTPEPSTLLLLGTGLLGLAFVAFRKAKSSGQVLQS